MFHEILWHRDKKTIGAKSVQAYGTVVPAWVAVDQRSSEIFEKHS